MKKSQIRKFVLEKRQKNNLKNKIIDFDSLVKLLKKKAKDKKIGLYYPVNTEISTLELIKKLKKKKFVISLPVVEKNFSMSFYEWSHKSLLKINSLGIPEPLKIKKILPSTLIVPIVAFDNNLNRIGYGGGYYDRFITKLEKTKKLLKIGLALSCQKINKVPTNRLDKKMDYIFTENKVYK